ncbi:MAG: hypothetical protein HOG49_30450 [Candidatus Scalindua sp.]|jgi:hypothetical protein|nr:hypothetical protein [Candidatus Scalindua sp.]
MIIEDVISDRIAKLKAVKEYSDKKSLPNWKIPVMHSIMLCLLGSIYTARFVVNPSLDGKVPDEILSFMPLILLGGAFFTIMDSVAKVMVWVNWAVIKGVMKTISKIDYRIWRNYKKEDYIANKIWKIQMKFHSLGKVNRRRLMAVLIMFMVMWMSYRVMY